MSGRHSGDDGPLLGVLGGMGPLATIHFYRCIVELTPAEADQDHLRTLIWSDPTIPDRTCALVGGGPSPVPKLRAGLRQLERGGADAIAIPCNTAHAFLPELLPIADVPIIDMVRATVRHCAATLSSDGVIGVLATRGTRQAGLYDDAARKLGLRVAYPTEVEQAAFVDPAIALVKSGGDLRAAGDLVGRAAESLRQSGAGVVVGACTEIPVAAEAAFEPLDLVDSVRCLAQACLEQVGRLPRAGAADLRPAVGY